MYIYSTIYIGMVQNLLDYGYCGIVVTGFKGVTRKQRATLVLGCPQIKLFKSPPMLLSTFRTKV